MKKTMILAAAALVAGSALAAEVLSVNAVGFIQTTCPAGELTALSYPFYGNDSDVGGTAWTNTPIAQNATGGASVYFWNGSGWSVGQYAWNARSQKYEWNNTAKAKILAPGECFLYKPAEAQDAVVSGEVPDEATIPLTVAGAGALTSLGLPYPTDKAWLDTELAAAAPGGASVYFWNGTGWSVGQYAWNARSQKYEWNNTAKAKTLKAGEGFLYKLPADAQDAEVSCARPYDWPAEPVEIVNP